MIRTKHFIIGSMMLYLSLIFYEHVFLATDLSRSEAANNLSVPGNGGKEKQQLNANENQTIIMTNRQTFNMNEKCQPLPPPQIPRIYLHIGPHKTGTTSLQDYLACNTKFLSDHKTFYLGKVNMHDVKSCDSVPPDFLRPLIQTPNTYYSDKLRLMIKRYQKGGNNVILSSEDIFDIPRNYTDELFASIPHVYPVVGYRRLYEWLLSSYRFNYGLPKWYDMDIWRSWDGHESIPTFRSFLKQNKNMIHPTLQSLSGFYQMQQTKWKPCPQILNFHMGDVTRDFMKLITADDSVPPSVFTNVNNNEDKYAVDCEILALKLQREKQVNIILQRRVVVDVLQYKMSKVYKNATPPLDCLTPEEENSLLEATKLAEQEILPDFYKSPHGEAAIDEEFRKASDRKVFCNIDLDKMLKEPVWEKMILKLKKGRLRQDDFKPFVTAPV